MYAGRGRCSTMAVGGPEPGMRYTSDLAMNERSLRDVERWKDKIEVRLDNRQVFFLFFGSALVACLLFIRGGRGGRGRERRGRGGAREGGAPRAPRDRGAPPPPGPGGPPPGRGAAPPAVETPSPIKPPAAARLAEPAPAVKAADD